MTFRIHQVSFERRELEFSDVFQDDRNYFTVLIGKNGTGKSRLMAAVANAFLNLSLGRIGAIGNSLGVRYSVGGWTGRIYSTEGGKRVFTNNPEAHPSRVICATSSPFDRFPMPSRRSIDKFGGYRYLGSRARNGEPARNAQIGRFVDSLADSASRISVDRDRFANVFQFLGFNPIIRIRYQLDRRITIRDSDSRKILSVIEELVDQVSSSGRATDFGISTISKNTSPNRRIRVNELSEVLERVFSHFRFRPTKQNQAALVVNLREPAEALGPLIHDLSELVRLGLARISEVSIQKLDSRSNFKLSKASSGERAVLLSILGIALELADNALVFLDEPELSLHPAWQEKFIDLLNETYSGFRGCHFILATHSPQILARLNSENASVLSMDSGLLHSASEYSERSSDFQLVEAFGTPGPRNEYLVREALTVYSRMSSGMNSEEDRRIYRSLLEVLPKLSDADPVAEIIRAIKRMAEA